MLRITVPGEESWDRSARQFVYGPETVLELEHSLTSVSKWEQTFEKPFLTGESRSDLEAIGYVIAMNTTPDVPPEIFSRLTEENLKQINDYINAKMTATTVREIKRAETREQITAELIYYWMFQLRIPMEVQHWHLNQLFMLVKVYEAKNEDPKKRRQMTAAERRAENRRRLKEYETSG